MERNYTIWFTRSARRMYVYPCTIHAFGARRVLTGLGDNLTRKFEGEREGGFIIPRWQALLSSCTHLVHTSRFLWQGALGKKKKVCWWRRRREREARVLLSQDGGGAGASVLYPSLICNCNLYSVRYVPTIHTYNIPRPRRKEEEPCKKRRKVPRKKKRGKNGQWESGSRSCLVPSFPQFHLQDTHYCPLGIQGRVTLPLPPAPLQVQCIILPVARSSKTWQPTCKYCTDVHTITYIHTYV